MSNTTSSFYFKVNEIAAIASTYDRKDGLKRSFNVTGYCDNGPTDSKDRFQLKGAKITFFSGKREDGWLAGIEEKLGITDIVGMMLIRQNVEPVRYDDEDYGPLYDPPIEVTVIVDDNTLDRLWETSKGTMETQKVLSLHIMLASRLFPENTFGSFLADDFDITEDRRYGIVSFDLKPHIVRQLRKEDARPRPIARHLSDAAYLGLRIDEVKVAIPSYAPLAMSHVTLLGRAQRPTEHKDAMVEIEVREFDLDRLTYEYPAEAHPGTFHFFPGYITIILYFTVRETSKIVPLLLASAPFTIGLSLSVTKDDLVSANGSVQGHVSSYSIDLTSPSAQS